MPNFLRSQSHATIGSSTKTAVAAQVSAAATDLIRILQSAEEQRRAGIDGAWGDEYYRDLGFLHQVVSIALSSDAYDQIAAALGPYMIQSFGKQSDPGAPGWFLWPSFDPPSIPQRLTFPQVGLPPMDPHLCDWDDNPQLFAVQIDRVRENLRWFLTWQGVSVPADPAGTVLPPPPTTYEAGIAQALGVDLVNELRAYYDVPILGWCLAIINLVIEILYAIFGTASAVETQAVPLQEGEQDAWAKTMAGTTLMLRGIESQARAIAEGGSLKSALWSARAPSPMIDKRASTARTVAVVAIGTGAALALVWVLLA